MFLHVRTCTVYMNEHNIVVDNNLLLCVLHVHVCSLFPPPPPQPVRAELMQALWSTLHNPYDNVATVAYRVLGKFGGSNRKMLSTPQPVSQKNKHQLLISYFSKEILHLNTLY